ncbi:hypothetical protein D3C79_315970 [compost metagenome]
MDFSTADPVVSSDAETPMISAPASANASAIALPIPLLQPVTKATFPVKSKDCSMDIILSILSLMVDLSYF